MPVSCFHYVVVILILWCGQCHIGSTDACKGLAAIAYSTITLRKMMECIALIAPVYDGSMSRVVIYDINQCNYFCIWGISYCILRLFSGHLTLNVSQRLWKQPASWITHCFNLEPLDLLIIIT